VVVFVVALISRDVFHASIDPTEQSLAVTLHNDSASAVVLKQCDAKCDSFHEQDRLLPGASVRVNASSDNVANWWLVTDSDGRAVGCLPLRYGHEIAGLVVNISERTACPAAPSASGSDVFGSILGFALVFGVAGIGVASIVFTTLHAHGWIVARGLRGGPATALTSLAAVVAIFGGWLIFDFYVVIRQGARWMRRLVAAT
jgi:hypothetical protein